MELILEFGAERFPLPPKASRKDRIARSKAMLARALNVGNVVAFVGSGCSAPLGYPTWKGMVTDVVQWTARRHRRDKIFAPRLGEMQERLHSGDAIASRDLIFYLGFCQSILGQIDFRDFIAQRFKRWERKANREGNNPHRALLDLPIERFVTSNYDHELEKALERKFHRHKREPFTQQKEDHGLMAGFALAKMPELQNAVFHCHGSVDAPDSIIATEADYQEWYLKEDSEHAAFRQSLQLLFGSNPILFIGFGMEDDDLLRQLRIFSAVTPEEKSSRPFFALLPERNPATGRDHDRLDSLYDRYGLHVIPYPSKPFGSVVRRGKELCDAIRGLRETWRKLADHWVQKPAIRRIEMPRRKNLLTPYKHYSVVLRDDDDLAPRATEEDVRALVKIIQKEQPRVLVITGDGGCGKSWRALNVLKEVEKERGRFANGGIFFWSSYYTDDWLTGLDRALSYLGAKQTARERRLDRFQKCLHSGNHLIVFDGFERLLRETQDPKLGAPYSRSVETLLDIIAAKCDRSEKREHRSTVILTTRLMPESLRERDSVREFAVQQLTTNDLRSGMLTEHRKRSRRLSAEERSELCSLCGGHAYALLLAAKYLTREPGELRKRMRELRHELGRRPPDARNTMMISLALQACDEQTRGLASALIDRLAIFMTPVDQATLKVCWELATAKTSGRQSLQKVTRVLREARLLFDVITDSPERDRLNKITVHPTVRSFVFRRRHEAEGESLPNFTLAGFTSGNAVSHPGNDASVEMITALFDRLCTAARKEKSSTLRRAMCRSAFGVLRSRMESNTVPRWTSYSDYIRHVARLMFLTKSLSGKNFWYYAERTYAARKQRTDGILYADELAWLYNDLGLALCSEGAMSDAYALWEQGYEVDRITDSEEEGGQYIVQSRLHMAHLFLELGRLRDATDYLASADRANAIYGDADLQGRIIGYRALLEHLAGNLSEADALYQNALDQLRRSGRHNLRAESIFTRFYADLMMTREELVQAEELVHEALSRAEEGNFPDLVAYARKTQAHVWREQKKYPEAQAEYNAAMEVARRRGIRRLQADLHSELARLALDVGDWETARRRAIESLMLANELNLGLRRTHGLVVLGRATAKSGNRGLAVHYFRHAHRLAQEQGYYLRGREAITQLQRLGDTAD